MLSQSLPELCTATGAASASCLQAPVIREYTPDRLPDRTSERRIKCALFPQSYPSLLLSAFVVSFYYGHLIVFDYFVFFSLYLLLSAPLRSGAAPILR